jgi:hypothetical protein
LEEEEEEAEPPEEEEPEEDVEGAEEAAPEEPEEGAEAPELDCGACFGPCSPNELGLASGGIAALALAPVDRELDERGVTVACLAAIERPGVTAEASAAKPAVTAAAASSPQRRMRPRRASAASRSCAEWERMPAVMCAVSRPCIGQDVTVE